MGLFNRNKEIKDAQKELKAAQKEAWDAIKQMESMTEQDWQIELIKAEEARIREEFDYLKSKGVIKLDKNIDEEQLLRDLLNNVDTPMVREVGMHIGMLRQEKMREDLAYLRENRNGVAVEEPQPYEVTINNVIYTSNQHISFANIVWRILDIQGDKALLISESAIERRRYNIKQKKDITWERCSLREYLNNEFYEKMGAAKQAIIESRINNLNNQWYDTNGGNVTTDKVFLLSLGEVCCYFGDSTAYLKNEGTYMIADNYNNARIAKASEDGGSEQEIGWWLRSPGISNEYAAWVGPNGQIVVDGVNVNNGNIWVRPALWLNLSEDVGILDSKDILPIFHNILEHCFSSLEEYKKTSKDGDEIALNLNKKILELQCRVFGEEHVDVATTFNRIGLVYSNIGGKVNEKLEYYQKALEIRLTLLGEEHKDTATSYSNVGLAKKDLGDYSNSLEYLEKALEIRRRVLGEGNLKTAMSYKNVGDVYSKLDNKDKALEHYHTALSIREKLLEPNHTQISNLKKTIEKIK